MSVTPRLGSRRAQRTSRGQLVRRAAGLDHGRRGRGKVRDALTLAMDRHSGATLSELARDVAAPTSSVQAALGRLVEDGLVRADGGRYALAVEETFHLGVLYLAASGLGRTAALRVLLRADPSVELGVLDESTAQLHLGFPPFVEPRRAADLITRLRELFPNLRHIEYELERYRGRTIEAAERNRKLRATLRTGRLLKGELAKAFPLPGPGKGRQLRRPHPSLRPVSRRARQALARRYHLAELSLFGSAVRGDFRPESDVDVLVRFQRGVRPSLEALAGLKLDLEGHFGRRVDVVATTSLDAAMRRRVEVDKVRLYGRGEPERLAPAPSEALRGAGTARVGGRRPGVVRRSRT